jgi:F-type H+-transporting ATPase subunit delta
VASDQQTHETHDVGAQRIARLYAEALYAAAEKAGAVDDVQQELSALVSEVLDRDARFEVLLSGAALGRDARSAALEKAFKDRISQTLYAFLQVLNGHERLELVRPIARALHDLADEKANRVRVFVTSAIPLDEDQLASIRSLLQEKSTKQPVMVASVDPSLLGGMKVRVGDLQYDGSVKTRIDNLRNQILEASSHEIQSRRDRLSSD